MVLGFVPTGDGFYVLLRPELAGYALLLAASLRSALLPKKGQESSIFGSIRTAVHHGEVAPFRDVTGKENFVGDGMNSCARLLEAKPCKSPTEDFPYDESFIIVLREGLGSFHKAYPDSEQLREFLKTVCYVQSEEFSIQDKHERVHYCRFVEFSRHAVISPPKPMGRP
jgi:hypothetical protein